MPGGLPGGMLEAGIDLHITKTRADAETRKVKNTETKLKKIEKKRNVVILCYFQTN